MIADARTAWQQREDRSREQEEAVVAIARERNAAAREGKLTGEVVLRFRYKDGGITGKRVETHEDVK